jgi:hypothetical protein
LINELHKEKFGSKDLKHQALTGSVGVSGQRQLQKSYKKIVIAQNIYDEMVHTSA